jgi:hypothetical protein
MGLLRWVNKRLRFPSRRVEKVRSIRTSSLIVGAIYVVLVAVSPFVGGWHLSTTFLAVAGVLVLTQGVLADLELNRREHRNYPPTDPDGMCQPVDVADQ